MRLWALIVSIAVIFGATPAPAADWRSSGSGFYLMGTRHIMTSLHVVAEGGDLLPPPPLPGDPPGHLGGRLGIAPLRILSTKCAACLKMAGGLAAKDMRHPARGGSSEMRP